MKRPDWDDYFCQFATVAAKRSTCMRRQVGALIVKDQDILATGYNGNPTGMKHCSEIGCMRQELGVPSGKNHELCTGLHAEQNAIIQAAKHGISIKGATLYCTNTPCSTCAKMIIQAEIKRVVHINTYPDPLADRYFKEAGVALIHQPVKRRK